MGISIIATPNLLHDDKRKIAVADGLVFQCGNGIKEDDHKSSPTDIAIVGGDHRRIERAARRYHHCIRSLNWAVELDQHLAYGGRTRYAWPINGPDGPIV